MTLELEDSLPYSEALVKGIINNYKPTTGY